MAQNAPPSRDPANDGDMVGMLQQVLRKFLQSVDDMLPARVIAYDRAKNRAQVQPLVRVLTTGGAQVARAPIASVPVMVFGGGGYLLSFPLRPGDLGWVKANDRDISLMLQSGKESPPNTLRMHSFDDAVFIPDAMRGYTIDVEDGANVVLQTLDGSARVAVGPASVKLTAGPAAVTVTPEAITLDGTTVIINGRPFLTHAHGGVQPGSGTSGGVA